MPVASFNLRSTNKLLKEVRGCDVCRAVLPLGPRPVLQVHPEARILIAGQAPGSKVHTSGVPFDDASGDRLRDWMGIDKATFYDAKQIAILPMGFCYPGTGKSGDLPPRPECATAWREKLLAQMPNIQLTLVIGQYAQAWHLRGAKPASLTDTVLAWKNYWPQQLPLPHPSPRNNIWLSKNPWFEKELLPALRGEIRKHLKNSLAA
jgi:uracil-DNA glycosylase